MSLWLDKYRPTDLSKLHYHHEQAENLRNLTKQGDFPHLLVYGPAGAGKKTRIMCLLKELYGPGVEKLRIVKMNFTTASNKKLEVSTLSSNYHIEVNPADVGIYDRIVVMELIKNVAQSHQLDVNGQREFKVIVLTGVDELTKDAQHALRRTMEKYITHCRLILCANSTSLVTPAIKSRCLSIRVPAPTAAEIINVLQIVAKKEKYNPPEEMLQTISQKCDRNLRRALLMLQAASQDPKSQIREPDWMLHIQHVADEILTQQSIQKIANVRNMLYELIIHNIPTNIIFKTLLDKLLAKCDISLHEKVVGLAAEYEHRLHHGNKKIFHLEAFVANFMYIYKEFLEDALDALM